MKLYDKLKGFVGKAFYQWGDFIGIYPTPTETKSLRIHYVRKPLDITGTQNPEIKEEYHEGLIYYTVMEIALRINPQLSKIYEEKWNESLNKCSQGSKIYYPEKVKSTYKDY